MDFKYQRILLKLSGEAMGGKDGKTIDFDAVEHTASQLINLQKLGVQVGVVLGGGNIWRGRSSGSMDRNRADHMGMLATVINSLAVQDAVEALGGTCTVMCSVEMQRFCETYSAREANARLRAGEIVIFAGGSGCPFFSTDTAAALRAAEIGADALLLAKNVDAVYSKDPVKYPDAERFSHLSYEEVIVRDLKATDMTAITLCREQHIPILVFAMKQPENILNAVCGKEVGTLID